ncbi:MAG: hypothetical protein RID81_22240 [Sandaracinaceae bacterium]
MQQMVERLRTDLAAFIEQRESLALVLWAKQPLDSSYALKLLGSLDEVSDRDVFILFAEDCYDPSRYLDSLMAACDMDIDTGNRAIAAGAGSDDAQPWESVPPSCFEEGRGVQGRLRALVEHLRRYYPDATHRLVFGFLPAQLTSPGAYAEFVRALLPVQGYEPWMAGVRLIVQDSQLAPTLVPELVHREGNDVLVRPIDFSTDALTQGLVDQLTNPGTPESEKMSALVQVAALDHAWKRYDDALRKYGTAYTYYLTQRNDGMQGVCLLFAGYTLEQMARLEEAKEKYRQALELAIASDLRQLILNATMALGAAHQQQGDWAGASDYWMAAAATAKVISSFWVLADCAEKAGLCQLALNQTGKALEFWDAAKKVGTQVHYWDRVIAVLEHSIEVERRANMSEEAANHEKELMVARHERERALAETREAKQQAKVQA